MKTDIIPAYPYRQFFGDAQIRAFFKATNTACQEYLDWFVNTPIPDYTSDQITGPLLDWVANGLYGMQRVPIPFIIPNTKGPTNSFMVNELPVDGAGGGSSTASYMSDDTFKRCITWNFYKGDGFDTSIPWLRRRVLRFMTGTNGADVALTDYTGISVTVKSFLITITLSDRFGRILPYYFDGAVNAGILNVPAGYSVSVVYTAPTTTGSGL